MSKQSIRPGEALWQEYACRPWYGCQNMETDAPCQTGSRGHFGEWDSHTLSSDQKKLWDAHCFVELVDEDSGVVCSKRRSDALLAEKILGRKLNIVVV